MIWHFHVYVSFVGAHGMLMLCFVTWADDPQIHAKGPLIDRPWASLMITREKGEKEREFLLRKKEKNELLKQGEKD